MASVPCPQKDGGLCTIPRPVVLGDGRAARVGVDQLAERLREIDLRNAVLIDAEISDAELVSELRRVEREADVAIPALRTALQSPGDSIVVNCSCGHRYVVDL